MNTNTDPALMTYQPQFMYVDPHFYDVVKGDVAAWKDPGPMIAQPVASVVHPSEEAVLIVRAERADVAENERPALIGREFRRSARLVPQDRVQKLGHQDLEHPVHRHLGPFERPPGDQSVLIFIDDFRIPLHNLSGRATQDPMGALLIDCANAVHVTHEARQESVLFSFSDRPAQKVLGLWREDASSSLPAIK